MSSPAQNLDWIEGYRKAAEARFSSIPKPHSKDENYKFTNLRDIDFDSHTKAVKKLSTIPVKSRMACTDEAALITVRSGSEKVDITVNHKVPALLADFNTILKDTPDLLYGRMEAPEVFKDDLFAQLACARWQNGILLYIPKGMKIEKPIRGLHFFDEESGSFYHRTQIIVAEGAEVTYIDEFASSNTGDKNPFASGLIDIYVQPGGKLNYSQIQNFGPKVFSFVRENIVAEESAVINHTRIATGGSRSQTRTESDCQGPHARIKFLGAVRGDKQQSFDFWMTSKHDVTDTVSECDYYTVVADKARAQFNGTIHITPKGMRTDAYQRNKSMLLSERAEVCTMPKLDIRTDDVKCAHGASVSPVDETQIYYLQSRGIPKPEAELMIIDGFTAPVIAALPTETLRELVQEIFSQKKGTQNEG